MSELAFYWLALAAYVVSTIAFMFALTMGRPRVRALGVVLAVVGLALHTFSLGLRWLAVGHGPYISTFEILSSTAWSAVLLFLILQWRVRSLALLGAGVMPLVFVMMGLALFGSLEARTLPPSLRSAWLIVHVVFAKLTIGSLLLATALAGFRLSGPARGRKLWAHLPSEERLDDYGQQIVGLGFIAITIMIITGAVWANNAWGSYWSWDPTQTWSLLVWIVYGIFLHGRYTFGWSGRFCAWYVVGAFAFSVVTFFVLPYFIEGLHAAYMSG